MKWSRISILSFALAIVAVFSIGSLPDLNGGIEAAERSAAENVGTVGVNFPASNVGPIPDNSCGTTDLVMNVPVSGTVGPLANVEVNLTLSPHHTWVGDLDMELVSPDGTRHWIQSWTGGNADAGYQSDVGGPYTFSDLAPSSPTWWEAAGATADASPIPAGSYRTQGPGPSATQPPITNMTAAFAGIPSVNGTWQIVIGDCASGDTGSVAEASLNILTEMTGPADNDYDGDGMTDFVVTQEITSNAELKGSERKSPVSLIPQRPSADGNIGNSLLPGGSGTNMSWWVYTGGSGSVSIESLGNSRSTDFVTPADFDGDGSTDFAVWRPVTTGQPSGNAFFYILKSSDSTIEEVDFGQSGDNPQIVGDYDGDGKADPAVFRQSLSGPGQAYFYYKGSDNNAGGNITYVQWGYGDSGNLKSYRGDFDGDDKLDFAIYRDVSGQGQFVIRRSSDLGTEYINWGIPSDTLAPGDYDGDGQSDFMVVRIGPSLEVQWYLLEKDGGGTGASPILWGTVVGMHDELVVPGDYDGDGGTDIAVYRVDATNPSNNYYYVRRSSDLAFQYLQWGSGTNSVPVNGWDVQ
ncbi:MAG: FG-GAP-like repeat-containing protein [Acidobacteriota bacterium]|nr:FG-GAP-like repeat-containing protein [Acidobacteriota bacterium]